MTYKPGKARQCRIPSRNPVSTAHIFELRRDLLSSHLEGSHWYPRASSFARLLYFPKKLGSIIRSLNRIFTLFEPSNLKMLPAGPEIQPIALSLDRGQGSSPYSIPVSSASVGGSSPSIRTTSRSSSSLSIPFDDEEVDVVRVEGVRHAEGRLEAR